MTALEMARYIGRQGYVTFESLEIPVTISDVRNRFGSVDVEISPVKGSGTQWVTLERVAFWGEA